MYDFSRVFGATGAGLLYVIPGPITADQDLATADSVEATARTLARAGDVNGDGRVDLLVGNASSDLVGVFYGPVLGTEAMWWHGDDYLGQGLAGVGDINNDGLDDWAMGAYLEGSYGKSWVVYGGLD